ncbi:fluoride efflux transporter FluC [Halococcus sp. AFM35]|uniref:fluoride efflux transporter FluC n=1 Tax=Halococcus sp. AFM35 TaxID=3421653 RepID=UPI003EBCD364
MADHPLRTLEAVALIAIGGFAGSNLRYLVARVLPGVGGTLLVNIVGSFVLGFLLYEARYTGILTQRARLVLTTGFLSSLTTYSTFALQTALLDSPGWMVANVFTTYTLGFSGVLAGRALARRVDGGTR